MLPADVERRAGRLLDEFAVTEPSHLVLEDICADAGLLVEETALVGCDAMLVGSGMFGIARVRADLPFRGQKRFATAHELGHWLMHRSLRQEFCDDADSLRRYHGSPEEVEANLFASALLLPLRAVRPHLDSLSLQTVLELARTWEIGPLAAARRTIGLAFGRPVQMFVAREGRSRYYVLPESPALPSVPAQTRLPAPERAEARRAPGGSREAAADWWPGVHGTLIVESVPLETTEDELLVLRLT